MKIAIAAFLHDIGKFRQKAGFKIDGNIDITIEHALHTRKVLEEIGIDEELINLSSNHHLENTTEDEEIIKIANLYAGRLDRKESEELSQEEFISSALETPFSFINFGKNIKKYYYKLQKLGDNLAISDKNNVNKEIEYKKLYEEFINELKNLKFDNFLDILKLKSIYEKYTSFIPSSTHKTYPDVSLFDHSLATAAIAMAIKNGNKDEFSLIQGDFTAIQSFIFSKMGESNKHLAKILRAKSLFVNVSTEIVALKIIKILNLSPFNIVMNAGGKFMILSHRLDETDLKKLQNIQKWVNDEFKEINYLQTKFVIKHIDFTKDKFELGKFADVYKEMAQSFEVEKLKFEPEFNQFENYLDEAKKGICKICGIVPTSKDSCEFCQKFEEIGTNLPKTKYINFNLDSLLSIELSNKKSDLYFGFDEYPIKRIANLVPKFSKEDINSDKYNLLDDEKNNIKEGQIKSFSHIAVDGLKKEYDIFYGRKYLAVLKADIDNLGKIFICGFNKQDTFSRILYLSRMIDYFFTTILMKEIKDKNIYTVFAGGDDLFLIGHYDDIIKTYSWIITNFREYTKNENFHLSASVKLFRPNIPIHLVAEFAEEELDKAKNSGKNSVVIFDVVYKNNEFNEFLKEIKFFEDLYSKLKELDSGISFMYKFYDFIEMAYKVKNNENIVNNSRWIYLMRYLIEKNFEIKNNDKNKKLKEEIKQQLYILKDMIKESNIKLILPLNLFLYSIRKN